MSGLEAWLSHGSLALMFVALVGAGLGLPLPEDVVLITAGTLAHRQVVVWPEALAVCMAGVLVGDLVLFSTAKRLGPHAADRPLFRRLLTPERRARIEGLFSKHGGKVVFMARHVAGLRAPTFALAGMNGMPTARFLVWDALGLCISGPLYFTLGFVFSRHIDELRQGIRRVEHGVVALALLVAVIYGAIVIYRRYVPRRPNRERPSPHRP